MEFRVTKTSGDCYKNGNPKSPCKGAVAKIHDRLELRTCTEEEFDRCFSWREGLWRSEGYGHETYDNGRGISRWHKDEVKSYFIQIDDLENLMKFNDEHGPLIISHDYEFPTIEIYNDYRE